MRISDWSSDVCSSDLKVRVHLRHQIKELQRKLGVTTIMVTHDQEEALSMPDRILVMNHGVIEQIGTPTEIYRAPRSLFVADFIGVHNPLHSTPRTPSPRPAERPVGKEKHCTRRMSGG